jgi:glycosyltransferase involved in cell wall biosynthesis
VPEPLVSVVVATYNRPARLARLLASLRAQSLGAGSFEVIVVDDGSAGETAAVIAGQLGQPGLALRVVHHPVRRGPAAARNSGWRTAAAPLVAFTDDDCVADPDWLQALLSAAARAPGALVQGRTVPDPGSEPGLLARTVRVERLGPQYETCNMLYPRSVLESLRGFDEAFGTGPAAEDTDLAWRALEAGHPAVFAERAVVRHAVVRVGAVGMLRFAWRWRRAMRIFAEHPGTRTMLYRGIFWNVWHYLLWRSVLACAGPVWLRRWVIARHLRELSRRAVGAGSGPWGVPFLLLYDAVECAAVVTGAMRSRTFVL